MAATRITQLADGERARFNEWADKWIEIGLRTGPADRERFEASVRECYRFAGIPFPEVVVWVPSPLVLAMAAPTSALAIELIEAERRGTLKVSDGAVDGAVGGAVRDAVGDAVPGLEAEVRRAVYDAIGRGWVNYIGGQFWAGGWWRWSAAYTSYFREVCNLELQGDLWDRGRAYEATVESACWWWPHRRFVMVCERPTEIHRELTNPDVERGWGSHRLHNADGPAVVWPDGWGVWSAHGVRVTKQIVEAPETLTVEQILGEENAEVRRVMMERFGFEKLIDAAEATLVDADVDQYERPRELWRLEVADDEPLVMVRVVNSTPEPDGHFKNYTLRVPPTMRSCQEALAWTFDMDADVYAPTVET